MSSHTTVYNVAMSCGKCAEVVTNRLMKVEGVQDVQCSLETQKVTVIGSATPDEMLQAIQKTGKKVSLAE